MFHYLEQIGIFITLQIIFIHSGSAQTVYNKIRQPVDTIGFAVKSRQMDSVISRIGRQFDSELTGTETQDGENGTTAWKAVICPHDDYAYAGKMYPEALGNIPARVALLFGVAHKARMFDLEQVMLFDSYETWQSPYGPVKVSGFREKLMEQLAEDEFVVHDSVHAVEHSLEALLPFLQFYQRNIEIVPILVPYMSYERMNSLSSSLAGSLHRLMESNRLEWGKDIVIIISNDAVHYGCEEWGGHDYAPYGCDSAGYKKAMGHDSEIIGDCLEGELTNEKILKFTKYTVQDTNFRTYKWTWCGRYSVPFGLLTAMHLQEQTGGHALWGTEFSYSTSIDHPVLPLSDVGMGVTGPANIRHWVGYVTIGIR
jgi:AmmeMemoRadiSam system protein B